VAWVGLFLAVITPPHGLGFSLCWFESTTGIPCPGCGVTRSLSCGLRGMFLESLHFHPMGLLILGLFCVTAIQSLLLRATRERLARFLEFHARFFNTLYLAFVASFVLFGVGRAIACCAGRFLNS
jgi:hypothetical protein